MAGRPNAVENSPYRKEIEEMFKEGKSDTFIAEWLKDRGQPISRQTINNYKNNKFNITLETQKKYNDRQSKKRLGDAADKQIEDIDKIDKDNNLIDTFLDEIDPEIISDMDEKDIARFFTNLLKTKDRKIRTKYQILGVIDDSKPVNVAVHNYVPIPTDPGVRARGRDFIQSIRTGQMESSQPGHDNK